MYGPSKMSTTVINGEKVAIKKVPCIYFEISFNIPGRKED